MWKKSEPPKKPQLRIPRDEARTKLVDRVARGKEIYQRYKGETPTCSASNNSGSTSPPKLRRRYSLPVPSAHGPDSMIP